MRNTRHRESTSVVYKWAGLFIALQVDLLVLQLKVHQQSHTFILSTFMREVLGSNLVCRRNYTKPSDIQKQELLPNQRISRKKSLSQNSSSTCVSHMLQKFKQDTYAASFQCPQVCHRAQTTSAADVPILQYCINSPSEIPWSGALFLSQKQY